MTRPGLDATVLSDLAATLFAALMLVLVVRLAVPEADPAMDPGEAARDLVPVERPVLNAEAMVALLARRGPGRPGLSVDLTEAGLMVAGSGPTEWLDGRDAGALGRLAGAEGEPVRLFVFSHRWYAAVRTALAGRETVEISVPRALRAPQPGRGFSPEFLALAARAGTPEAFRAGLARLLAAGAVVPGVERVSGRRDGAAPAAAAAGGTVSARWRARLDAALHVLMPGLGLAGIAAIEVAAARRARAHGPVRAPRRSPIP